MRKLLVLGLLMIFNFAIYAQHVATVSNNAPEIPEIDYSKFRIVGELSNKKKHGKYLYYNQLDELVL